MGFFINHAVQIILFAILLRLLSGLERATFFLTLFSVTASCGEETPILILEIFCQSLLWRVLAVHLTRHSYLNRLWRRWSQTLHHVV